MKGFMKFFRTLLVLLAGISLAYSSSLPKKDINILLVTIDTLRYDRVSVYSDKYVKTPNMDQIAADAWVFQWAFAHNPVTLPSHVNILTGTTPIYHGISDNPGFVLDQRFLTLAEYLKERKYATGAFIGSFPLDSRFGLDQGFDIYDDHYGSQNLLEIYFIERPAEKVIAPAMEWISGQSQKWFAWIHLFDPHEPYIPPPPFDQEYRHDPYSGEVAYVDAQLGRLFDFLQEKGMMENTVIVLTSDHGEALGEKGERTHSYFAYNNTIRIPLIIRIPGMKAETIEENVCHIDIFPTLCEVLGDKIPAHLQGESLLPIVKGQKRKNREIYFESLTPYLNRGWAPLTGFIRESLKYIDQPIREVYDIRADIFEDNNLAGSTNTKELEKDLEKLIQKLRGKEKAERFSTIDVGEMNRLRSLGYISDGKTPKKVAFSVENDLKTLKPLQNTMYEAVLKYREGKIREAINDLIEVIEKRPDFVLAYNHLASIYYVMGQHESTVEILRKGMRNNPKNLGLMSKLGIMLVVANRQEEAIDILQKCIKMDDRNPEYFNYLGVAHQKSGNFPLALENYKRAIEFDNNFALAWSNMGSLYLFEYVKTKSDKDFQRAIDYFNTALAFDPNLQAAINGKNAAYKFKEQITSQLHN